RLGTIQYHPSLLPRHRGISGMHWAIRGGETKTGLTIFWVDAGIDTGPILLQRDVDIGPDDTVGSLYFDKLFEDGVDALIDAVRMVVEGTAPKIEQDGSRRRMSRPPTIRTAPSRGPRRRATSTTSSAAPTQRPAHTPISMASSCASSMH